MQAEDKFSAAYQHSSNKLFNATINYNDILHHERYTVKPA